MADNSRFTGKTILVTGAASGIGYASAEQFALEGGRVIATDIDFQALEAAFSQAAEQGLAVELLPQDVTKVELWQEIIEGIVKRYGRLDVLFNNAGDGVFALLEDTTQKQWRAVNAVNQDSVFFGMQVAVNSMKKTGGGAIVNNSSIAAFIGEPQLLAYSATKGAVRAMTKAAAVDCARQGFGIRINSIHPGFTNTNLVAKALASLGDDAEEFAQAATQRIPLGRLAEPYEIARAVLFLASEDASYMTGSELVVDGGYTAS